MMIKINKSSHEGGYTYLNELSLSKIQMLHQKFVTSGTIVKEVTKVAYPISVYLEIIGNNKYKVVLMTYLHNEGGNLISKQGLRENMLGIMQFLKIYVTIDPDIKHTN